MPRATALLFEFPQGILKFLWRQQHRAAQRNWLPGHSGTGVNTSPVLRKSAVLLIRCKYVPGLVPYLYARLVTLGGETLHDLKELQRIPSLSRLFGLSKLLLPVLTSPATTVCSSSLTRRTRRA